ncbi:beta-eliminating lyase-related protein [Caulobacter sp. S45]|uniref:beta-eliminating lyase-related protein n=1 Tax=Caulobacter sp. S45 TaxID=1641861 RepID=UPI00131AF85C|nr:beta-eliminating lyase-related protein [Caulobacter sp. S45]
MTPRFDFASDNTAGAAPEALQALIEANSGFTSGYGTDAVTARAADAVRALLDADADVRFVASGTAANAVACAALCRPFESMLAHTHAHVITDETGAPGFFGHGLGLTPLAGASGKIDPAALKAALGVPEASYRQSPAALTVTNATEYGTVYTTEAVAELTGIAKAAGLPVHLDGARLANAVASGFDLKALKTLDIDILVMGGTKAGMPLSEAVVLFDKGLSRRFDARLKQAGQLPSKGRFISAPWIGMLADNAWARYGAHANAMARKLAALMPFPVTHPVEANGVFVAMDEPTLLRLRAMGWNVYRFTDGSVRFMCSWATTEASVEELGEALKGLA